MFPFKFQLFLTVWWEPWPPAEFVPAYSHILLSSCNNCVLVPVSRHVPSVGVGLSVQPEGLQAPSHAISSDKDTNKKQSQKVQSGLREKELWTPLRAGDCFHLFHCEPELYLRTALLSTCDRGACSNGGFPRSVSLYVKHLGTGSVSFVLCFSSSKLLLLLRHRKLVCPNRITADIVKLNHVIL